MKEKETDTAIEIEAHSHDHHVSDQERIDEAMLESFPASDPPSWTAGVGHDLDRGHGHEIVHDACAPEPDELKERGSGEIA
jgi:hypothetical protein